MVISVPPSSIGATMVQLLTASPLNSTVQAPHWLVSQPIWVPVRSRVSRSRSATRVAGSMSTSCARPLSVKLTLMVVTSDRVLTSGENAGAAGRPGGQQDVADIERIAEETALRNVGDEFLIGDGVEHHLDERSLVFDGEHPARQCRRLNAEAAGLRPHQFDVVAPHRQIDAIADCDPRARLD